MVERITFGHRELLVLFGPPAVGKMTLGRAVCALSEFRLFHNHHTIEPLHEIFGQESPGSASSMPSSSGE